LTPPEAEELLIEYAAMTASRNARVIAAVGAGVSKHRVYVLTGIARTTIDQILAQESPAD
jgi:hypothetical protein